MLPDAARCWIYVAERRLTEAEQTTLLDTLQAFFEGWASHGRPVQGAATCLDDRFLVVAGALTQEGDLSGCGIDASVHTVEEAAQRLGVVWASPLLIFYRDDDDAVISLPMPTNAIKIVKSRPPVVRAWISLKPMVVSVIKVM